MSLIGWKKKKRPQAAPNGLVGIDMTRADNSKMMKEPSASRLDLKKGEPMQKDDDDGESVSTVLSTQSRSDDEASVGSDSSCLRQLEIEFKLRDKLLKELLKGIDPTYAQVLRENETAARQQKILRAQGKQKDRSSKGPEPPVPPSRRVSAVANGHGEKIRTLERVRMAFACDWYNTMPGAAHMILYCIAHASCFQIMEACTFALTKGFKNQDVVAVVLILLSILLLRITGGMWKYLDYDSYDRIKFDMHNRLRLGKVDACVARWFRQHPKIQAFANLVAFYTTFESVGYLQERCMENFDRRVVVLVDCLRNLKQRILSDDTCVANNISNLEGVEALVAERHYTWYYFAFAVIAIFLLRQLGHPFSK